MLQYAVLLEFVKTPPVERHAYQADFKIKAISDAKEHRNRALQKSKIFVSQTRPIVQCDVCINVDLFIDHAFYN